MAAIAKIDETLITTERIIGDGCCCNLLIGVCCCSMVIFSLNLSSVDSDCFLGVVSTEFVIFVVYLLAVFASACRERFVDKRIQLQQSVAACRRKKDLGNCRRKR